jgi:hypothetical protein
LTSAVVCVITDIGDIDFLICGTCRFRIYVLPFVRCVRSREIIVGVTHL